MGPVVEFLTSQTENLGLSLLILVVIFGLRYMVVRAFINRLHDAEAAFKARRTSLYISVGLLLIGLGWVWTQQLANVGSFIGILSAGIAIALSDVLKNLAGWAYILMQRPLKTGDRIEVGPHAGDVIDIRVFRFSILEIRNWVDADQSTGRIVHIPNGILFTEPMANYTEGFPFIWHEVPVTVTFESDWEHTRDLVLEVISRHAVHPEEDGVVTNLERAAQQYFIRYGYLTPAVYVKAIDFGVQVTGRLLVPARGRRSINSKIWTELLRAINAHPHVDLAYPTTRFYRADVEASGPGGAGVRSPSS